MQARLVASDLACRRGDRVLFRGLSFALGPGDLLHVTGPNGIGKSSLLRILAGLLPPLAGSLEREGGLALLDERPALEPDWPLGRALAFWRALDGTGDSNGHDAIEAMALGNLLDVPVRYLSTGQQKRAAFAALLGRDAPIWLLDEPLNGLDAAARDVALSQIEQHCAGGGLCIVASHLDIALARGTALALEAHAPRGAEA